MKTNLAELRRLAARTHAKSQFSDGCYVLENTHSVRTNVKVCRGLAFGLNGASLGATLEELCAKGKGLTIVAFPPHPFNCKCVECTAPAWATGPSGSEY
jgi:hypothetical protein